MYCIFDHRPNNPQGSHAFPPFLPMSSVKNTKENSLYWDQ